MEKPKFEYRSVKINDWMSKKISERLKDFVIISIDVNAEVVARMDKISIINAVDAIFKDKDGKVYSLRNYSSDAKGYEENDALRWLVNALKEFELEAILKFGSSALNSKVEDSDPKVSEVEVVGKKEFGSTSFSLSMSTSEKEIAMFLTDPKYFAWAGPTLRLGKNSVSFENIEMRNIISKESSVEMEYKWNDWADFSKVKIDLHGYSDSVKITVHHSNIPVNYIENVKSHWMQRVFPMISSLYRCAIKSS